MRIGRAIVLSLVSALASYGQSAARLRPTQATVEMPVIGYVVSERTLEVRAIQGLPGSAWLSDPIPVPEGTTEVRFAPGHEWALLMRGSRRPAIWTPENGQVQALAETGSDMQSVAFSPSGKTMVLALTGGTLVRYRNLPVSTEGETLEVTANGAIAINDGGNWMAAAGEGRLAMIDLSTGRSSFLYESAKLGGFSFAAGSDQLAIADSGRGRAVIVENGVPRVVWSNGEAEPRGVWLEDGRLFVAHSGAAGLTVVETRSLQASEMKTAAPARFERLRQPGMLLLMPSEEGLQAHFGYLQDGDYHLGFWSRNGAQLR